MPFTTRSTPASPPARLRRRRHRGGRAAPLLAALAVRGEALRLLPPSVCPACGVRPGRPLCPRCRRELQARGRRAAPLPRSGGRSPQPGLDDALVLGAYRGALRRCLLAFKRGDGGIGEVAAGALAGALRRAGWLTPGAALQICWVPSPTLRSWTRPYTPAAQLARQLARATGLPAARLLAARHGTRRQAHLGRRARAVNAAAAYRARGAVRGCILLVDDVVTTGATARACAAALRCAGAESVRLVALARTPERRAR